MTPEQIESAEQIITYALDKLSAVELQHQANPSAIFGELLKQIVAAEYKIQAGVKASEQLFELIAATWDGAAPVGVDHAQTLDRVYELVGMAKAAAEDTEDPDAAHIPESPHFAGAVETEGGENAG